MQTIFADSKKVFLCFLLAIVVIIGGLILKVSFNLPINTNTLAIIGLGILAVPVVLGIVKPVCPDCKGSLEKEYVEKQQEIYEKHYPIRTKIVYGGFVAAAIAFIFLIVFQSNLDLVGKIATIIGVLVGLAIFFVFVSKILNVGRYSTKP